MPSWAVLEPARHDFYWPARHCALSLLRSVPAAACYREDAKGRFPRAAQTFLSLKHDLFCLSPFEFPRAGPGACKSLRRGVLACMWLAVATGQTGRGAHSSKASGSSREKGGEGRRRSSPTATEMQRPIRAVLGPARPDGSPSYFRAVLGLIFTH
jgi:hypothetical protein